MGQNKKNVFSGFRCLAEDSNTFMLCMFMLNIYQISNMQDYKRDVVSMDEGPVTVPGGFFKNPAGIRVALKVC